MPCCSARSCKNTHKNTKLGLRKIRFFRFKKNKNIHKQWLDFCGITSVTNASKLCSEHFRDVDFENEDRTQKLLKNAIPCK